jgi:transposase
LIIDHLSIDKNIIFRSLNSIHKKKRTLQQFLYSFSKSNLEGGELYFFDGTTTYFEGSKCDMGVPAIDKTTGLQNSVILICLLTDKKGFPIAWDTFEGNKKDQTEFKKIAQQLCDDMNIKEATFCFDRGVSSESNFNTIEDLLESKFVTGLRKNQIKPVFDLDKFANNTRPLLQSDHQSKKSKERMQRRIPSINGFYKFGKDRYYQDLGITNERRHIVSFNIKIYEADQLKRERAIQSALHEITNINIRLQNAKKDVDGDVINDRIKKCLVRLGLTKIISYRLVPSTVTVASKVAIIQSYRLEHDIDADAVKSAAREDGILVYITNHTESGGDGQFTVKAQEIVAHYKNKYVVENAFRHLKSFTELRPCFVRLDDHVKAHIDICMVSYFINRYIEYALRDEEISIGEFYRELSINAHTCTLADSTETMTLLKKLSPKMKKIIKKLRIETVTKKEVLEKYDINSNN